MIPPVYTKEEFGTVPTFAWFCLFLEVTKMFGHYKAVKERARDRERWREDIRKSEMPEPTRTTLTMTLRSQRGKPQD